MSLHHYHSPVLKMETIKLVYILLKGIWLPSHCIAWERPLLFNMKTKYNIPEVTQMASEGCLPPCSLLFMHIILQVSLSLRFINSHTVYPASAPEQTPISCNLEWGL